MRVIRGNYRDMEGSVLEVMRGTRIGSASRA